MNLMSLTELGHPFSLTFRQQCSWFPGFRLGHGLKRAHCLVLKCMALSRDVFMGLSEPLRLI